MTVSQECGLGGWQQPNSSQQRDHYAANITSKRSFFESRVSRVEFGYTRRTLICIFQGNDFILQRETLAREKLTKTLFLTLSIDFYFLRHVCLSTHVAGYGFHRCTSGRDGAVERSDSGVVHFGT